MEQKYIVGDVVSYRGKIAIVSEPCDNEHFDLFSSKEGLMCYADVNEFKPVKLVPKILEKNGWKKDNNVFWKKYKLATLIIQDGFISVIDSTEKTKLLLRHIEFVHELHHLLYGLGIEEGDYVGLYEL